MYLSPHVGATDQCQALPEVERAGTFQQAAIAPPHGPPPQPPPHTPQPESPAIVEEARRQRSLGRGIVWIRPGEKRPTRREWTLSSQGPEDHEPGCNLGLMTGAISGNLVCVDLDSAKALELADDHLPPTGMIDGRPGKPRSHRWYVVSDVPPEMTSGAAGGMGGPFTRRNGAAGIDFLGTGAQAVIPPSTHPAGEARVWEGAGQPASLPMTQLWAAVEALAEACGHPFKAKQGGGDRALRSGKVRRCSRTPTVPDDHDKLLRAAAYVGSMPPAIEGKGGDKQTYTVACRLVEGFDLTPEEAFLILREYNRHLCQPEWSDDDLWHKLECADASCTGERGKLYREGGGPGAPDPDHGDVLPFPLDVLPPGCRRFVREVSSSVGVAEDIPAMALLTVAGGLAGRKCALELKHGWREYPCLYVALVAESGSGKTPALSHVLRPARLADEALFRDHEEAWRGYRTAAREFKAGKRDAEPQRPTPCQLLIEDFTGEALGPILRDNPNGVILALDELSAWVSAMNQYRGGRGRDRQLFLSIWSGRPYRVDRKTAEGQGQGQGPILVKTPFVAVVGCIPPSQVAKLRGHQGDEGDGLVERVLFVQPPRRPLPDSLFDPSKQLSAESVGAWEGIAGSLLIEAGGGYRLSGEAKAAFEACYRKQVADEVNGNRVPDGLRPQWSKLTAYAGRLALILHLLRCAEEGAFELEVSAEAVRSAWRLVEYLKSHLRKTLAAARATAAGRVEDKVLAWARKKKPDRPFAPRDVLAGVHGLHDGTTREARAVLDGMVSEGTLRRDGKNSYRVA